MSKTPVSILQERSAKDSLPPPQYDLVFNRSDGVNPEFRYKVTFASVVAVGAGRSKKEAKHNAAESALAKLAEQDSVSSSDKDIPKEPVLSPYSNQVQRNYVGELLSYCSEQQLHDPLFLEAGAEGPSHAPRFTMKCTVSKFEETAEALTKKQAKQLVAKKMLHRIHNCMKDSTKVADTKHSTKVADTKYSTKVADTKHSTKVADTKYNEEMETVFQKLRNIPCIPVTMIPNSISELHCALKNTYPDMPQPLKNFAERKKEESWDPMTTVREVAEILNAAVEISVYKRGCFDSSPLGNSEDWVVQAIMDTNPSTVVMSYGPDRKSAELNTAEELLDHLYEMWK